MSPRGSRDSRVTGQTRLRYKDVAAFGVGVWAAECQVGFSPPHTHEKTAAMATGRECHQPVFNLCYNQHRELEAFGF